MIELAIYLTALVVWLLKETDWLRVNLIPQATAKQAEQTERRKWQFEKYGDEAIMLCRNCYADCGNRRNYGKDNGRWYGWRVPARTVTIFETTTNFNEGCNFQRAKLLKDIIRIQKRKVFAPKLAPLPVFIETVRSGYYPDESYTTTFKDCLISKSWLKKHQNDIMPEPTLELLVDGKQVVSLNGDYKRGTIRKLVKAVK